MSVRPASAGRFRAQLCNRRPARRHGRPRPALPRSELSDPRTVTYRPDSAVRGVGPADQAGAEGQAHRSTRLVLPKRQRTHNHATARREFAADGDQAPGPTPLRGAPEGELPASAHLHQAIGRKPCAVQNLVVDEDRLGAVQVRANERRLRHLAPIVGEGDVHQSPIATAELGVELVVAAADRLGGQRVGNTQPAHKHQDRSDQAKHAADASPASLLRQATGARITPQTYLGPERRRARAGTGRDQLRAAVALPRNGRACTAARDSRCSSL